MAEGLPYSLTKQLSGLTRLPAHRQFGLVLGLAVVVAVGVAVVLWGLAPSYQQLLPGLSEQDTAAAVDLLDRRQIPHRLDDATGALMVPADRVRVARMYLATAGVPHERGTGFELLDKDTGIGTSQLLESARYQRALEGELARSVETLDSVDSARVHLALPRQSVFLRDRVKPTASVLVNLHPGSELDDTQVAGIVNLVASSVAGLETKRVTVVDQSGRLLSRSGDGSAGGVPEQLAYTRKIEDAYRQRVEDILSPLVGADGMRVQVTADIDFTQVETTRETYDPNKTAIRSEQISDQVSSTAGASGVPGSLSNEPPDAATVAASGPGASGPGTNGAGANAGAAGAAGSSSTQAASATPVTRDRRSTRNYEVDRTIDHVRHAPAQLRRLSVAVVVDDKDTVDAKGQHLRKPRDAQEMQHLTSLVQEAVGFQAARGDQVSVVDVSFRQTPPPPALPATPVWQQPIVRELVRYGLAGAGFLLLVLLVLRPALKSLAAVPRLDTLPEPAQGRSGQAGHALPAGAAASGAADAGAPPEQQLIRARQAAVDDPRIAAQVVRQWISDDGK